MILNGLPENHPWVKPTTKKPSNQENFVPSLLGCKSFQWFFKLIASRLNLCSPRAFL
jgi:hypothetical protein